MLKTMPHCFEFDNDEISTLPIWINLLGLRLDLWNSNVLSKIASKVGKPISTYKLTSTKERLSYVRVLVEVDVLKELVGIIHMKLPTGKSRDQQVVYEQVPKFCAMCKMFWHSTARRSVNKQPMCSKEAGPSKTGKNDDRAHAIRVMLRWIRSLQCS